MWTRRRFLKVATATTVAFGRFPLVFARESDKAPPSDRIGLGFIGTGGMGKAHVRGFIKEPDVDIVAVCDVYDEHLKQAVDLTEGKAKGYKDYRELLERKDIDAVVIATPDHWHALPMIHACEAGKDVYVEKPLSLTIEEGRAMVNAARRYNRVVQVGTQQRAGAHFRYVVELIRSGRIGKIKEARTWFGPQGSGKWTPDEAPPSGLDWDMWLGPAPFVPYNQSRFRAFRRFWDYSGGALTDWGTHLIDIVHWATGEDAPVTIKAEGRYPKEGIYETPETLVVTYQYPDFVLHWTQLPNQHYDDNASHGYGIKFYGTDGEIFVDRTLFVVYPEGRRIKPIRPDEFMLPRVKSHRREFLDCVKTREKPTSDVEVGHRSTSAPHLGNIAFRVGREIKWDAHAERVVGDEEADRLVRKPYRAPWCL